MSIKESIDKDILNQEPIPLSRPIIITGSEILNASTQKLHAIMNKVMNEEVLTADEERLIKWLGRLENIIRRDNIYSLSIDEAADCGLIN